LLPVTLSVSLCLSLSRVYIRALFSNTLSLNDDVSNPYKEVGELRMLHTLIFRLFVSGQEWRKILLRITWFVDFVHCPEFKIARKRNVSETGSVSVYRLWEEDTYSIGSLIKS
jgi:hypothetical protein